MLQVNAAIGGAVGDIECGQVRLGKKIDGSGILGRVRIETRGGYHKGAVVTGEARAQQVALLLADEQPGSQLGSRGICREQIQLVLHTVAIGVEISPVAGFVAIGIGELGCVQRERIRVVAYAVAIAVDGFGGVLGKGVGVVAHAVAVRVGRFARVFGEWVGVVADAVAVGIQGFRCVAWERIDDVVAAVVVIVEVGVVADAIAVGVPPFVGVVGHGVHGVHEAVAVGIWKPLAMGGDEEANSAQASRGVGSVHLVEFGTARFLFLQETGAVQLGIGEHGDADAAAAVGHGGVEVTLHAVAPRPAPSAKIVLPHGVVQPHQVAEFVRQRAAGTATDHRGIPAGEPLQFLGAEVPAIAVGTHR